MTRNGTKVEETAPSERSEGLSQAPQTGRAPYHSPKLRHLGSVRELTLGPSNNGPMDNGIPGMMML